MKETSPDQTFSPVARTTPKRIEQRDQIEYIISQNQSIADIAALREEVLKRLAHANEGPSPCPATLQVQNRNNHLRPFIPFFRRLLDPHSASPRMRSLARNIQLAAQLGWQAQEFRQLPSVFDSRFSNPNDLIEPIFSAIFQDRDTGLLRQWMHALDAHVEASSRRTLAAMDQAAQQHQPPVRKDVVLVGGGALTSLVASVLGAFFHVTVITEQRGIGRPWRNRPLYINSSSLVKDFHAAPLPLLGGGTTRIIGRQQLNNLEADLLLLTETKSIRCENGSVVDYVAGPRLGDLVATNILFNVDDYLIKQWVDVPKLQRNANGGIRLALIDTQDGTRRELDASAVFLLSGPGKEQSNVSDASQLYLQAARQLESRLAHARHQLTWHRESLHKLETEPLTRGMQAQRQWIYERMAQTKVDLPRVLTLTAVEKLYEFWEECGSDPACFPLADLMSKPDAIAYIGDGDTMRTMKELVEGRGPKSAYPGAYEPKNGRSTIYNELATSPAEYDASNRRRYWGTYTSKTTAIPFKARRYRLLEEKTRVEVVHRDEQGRRLRRRYSYVFDCTGLDRLPIWAKLPVAFPFQKIRDLQGVVVALGNAEANLFIAGAVTGWSAPDFPEEIQKIIRALGIAENTLALWVNGLLAERLAYTYAATRPQTKMGTREQ